MRKPTLWLWLLWKRLCKRPVFLVLLILIPTLVWGYTSAARQDSGVLTVILAQEAHDPLTDSIFIRLQEHTPLIRYRIAESPAQARAAVAGGKADAAWIFPGDLQQRITAFAADPSADNAFITVVERESTVPLMLSHEKLNSTLYISISQQVYLQYLRQLAPELELSDEALLEYYRDVPINDALFAFRQAGTAAQKSYLTAPVRGMLAVITVLAALVAGMYHIRDLEAGTFAWLPATRQIFPELGGQLVFTGTVAGVCLLCMIPAGLTGFWLTELAALPLYTLCCGLFAMLLRRVFCSLRALGGVISVLTVLMLVLCPVFFDLGPLRPLQFLFPPTYYIHITGNPAFVGYLLLYTVGLGGLTLLADKFRR